MPREGINWAASNWLTILALLWCLLLLNVPLKLKHVTNIQNLPLMSFCQTSSVFSDPLDLLDHPLLLDIFFLGAPQLRAGVGFLFFYKVSFEKHPNHIQTKFFAPPKGVFWGQKDPFWEPQEYCRGPRAHDIDVTHPVVQISDSWDQITPVRPLEDLQGPPNF